MRVGDVYKIESMLKNGMTEENVYARFVNDYPKDEIAKFLPKKAGKSTGKNSKKSDPLG